ELADPGRHRRRSSRVNFTDRDGTAGGPPWSCREAGSDQGAPRLALGAAPQPAGRLAAALRASMHGLHPHAGTVRRGCDRQRACALTASVRHYDAPVTPRRETRLVVGFDLDMTLVDSRPGIAATLTRLEGETGAPVATDEMLDSLLRRNLDLEFARRFAADD